MREVVFDIEIWNDVDSVEGGWENPEAMGFGTAVAWDSKDQLYKFFGPEDKAQLLVLLTAADLVIGFNHMRFDLRVLHGNRFDYKASYETGKHCDLLVEIVRRKFKGCMWVEEAEEWFGAGQVHDGSCGLNGISWGTFGFGKCGHGADAPKMIREGRWPQVFQYNLHDVRLTRMVYKHWYSRNFVIDGKGNVIRRGK